MADVKNKKQKDKNRHAIKEIPRFIKAPKDVQNNYNRKTKAISKGKEKDKKILIAEDNKLIKKNRN